MTIFMLISFILLGICFIVIFLCILGIYYATKEFKENVKKLEETSLHNMKLILSGNYNNLLKYPDPNKPSKYFLLRIIDKIPYKGK